MVDFMDINMDIHLLSITDGIYCQLLCRDIKCIIYLHLGISVNLVTKYSITVTVINNKVLYIKYI